MPKFISDEEMAQLEASQKKTKKFISDEEMAKLESKPKEGINLSKDIGAGLRGFADTASFGTYPYLVAGVEKGLQYIPGYEGDKPELKGKSYDELVEAYKGKLKESKEESPIASGVGSVGGLFSGAGLLGKAVSKAPIVGKAYKALPNTFMGRAGQAGILGGSAGLLQTPETGFSDVGARLEQGAYGLGMGVLAQPAVEGLAKGIGVLSRVPSVLKPKSVQPQQPVSPNVTDLGKKYSPQSLDEIANIVKDNPLLKTVPDSKRLNDIVNKLDDLEYAPSKIHMEMSKDKTHKDIVNLIKKIPGEAENLQKYERLMKTEQQNKINDFVQKLGNRQKLDSFSSGENFINNTISKYEGVRQKLGPQFQKIESLSLPKQNHIPFLKDELLNVSKLRNRVGVDINGNLIMKEFDPNMGITPKAYDSVKKVIDSINKNQNLTISDLKEYRSFLRDAIDPLEKKSAAFITEVRQKLLNHSENLLQKYSPDKSLKEVSKNWALNERYLEKIEDIVGGDIEKIAPEAVLQKLFSNTKKSAELKKLIGDDEFKNLTGDYLNSLIEKVTQTNGEISSLQFANLLKKNKVVLENTLGKAEYEKLLARSDLMKLADAQSFNFSNTAPAMESINRLSQIKQLPNEMLERYMKGREEDLAKQRLNELLSTGKLSPEQPGLIDKGLNIGSKVTSPLKALGKIKAPKPEVTGMGAGLLAK